MFPELENSIPLFNFKFNTFLPLHYSYMPADIIVSHINVNIFIKFYTHFHIFILLFASFGLWINISKCFLACYGIIIMTVLFALFLFLLTSHLTTSSRRFYALFTYICRFTPVRRQFTAFHFTARSMAIDHVFGI